MRTSSLAKVAVIGVVGALALSACSNDSNDDNGPGLNNPGVTTPLAATPTPTRPTSSAGWARCPATTSSSASTRSTASSWPSRRPTPRTTLGFKLDDGQGRRRRALRQGPGRRREVHPGRRHHRRGGPLLLRTDRGHRQDLRRRQPGPDQRLGHQRDPDLPGFTTFHRIVPNDGVEGPAAADWLAKKAKKVFVVRTRPPTATGSATSSTRPCGPRASPSSARRRPRPPRTTAPIAQAVTSAGADALFYGGYDAQARAVRQGADRHRLQGHQDDRQRCEVLGVHQRRQAPPARAGTSPAAARTPPPLLSRRRSPRRTPGSSTPRPRPTRRRPTTPRTR